MLWVIWWFLGCLGCGDCGGVGCVTCLLCGCCDLVAWVAFGGRVWVAAMPWVGLFVSAAGCFDCVYDVFGGYLGFVIRVGLV